MFTREREQKNNPKRIPKIGDSQPGLAQAFRLPGTIAKYGYNPWCDRPSNIHFGCTCVLESHPCGSI